VTARNARARRLSDALGAVVPADDVRPTRKQGARACQSRAAEPEDGDLLSGKDRDGDHHRSLSVDSPTNASTTETIQKRITICGSAHPSASKWGGTGPIETPRSPVSLNNPPCTMTDTASSTNRPPTPASTTSCLVATAIVPIIPPRASEPVSPVNIEAGGALNQRKPSPAPITAPHTTPPPPVPAT